MKTLIIYESFHKMNTEKVAKAMAKSMKADLKKVEDAKPEMLKKYGLIGFGSGIYFCRHHELIINFVKNLPKQSKDAFIFSTSGFETKLWHNSLKSELKKKGFKIKGEFNCPGFETYGIFGLIGGFRKGRPSKTDLKNAEEFAKALIKK